MKVDELITTIHRVSEVVAEGVAVVSAKFTLITNGRPGPSPCLLAHGDEVERLARTLPKPLRRATATEVSYVCPVKILGIMKPTPYYPIMPLTLTRIYSIIFDDPQHGGQRVEVNERLFDVLVTNR